MASTEKFYILIAGVNGAGKSSLYKGLKILDGMPRINADEIARTIGDEKDVRVALAAGKKAIELRNELFEKGESFNQETTLSGHDAIRNIEKAKSLGYRVEMYYVGVDSAELCKQRIRNRVMTGGHYIPDEDVDRRFNTSFENLKKVLPECDTVYFYDNTEQMTLFSVYKAGKFIYYDTGLPQWFIQKVLQ